MPRSCNYPSSRIPLILLTTGIPLHLPQAFSSSPKSTRFPLLLQCLAVYNCPSQQLPSAANQIISMHPPTMVVDTLQPSEVNWRLTLL